MLRTVADAGHFGNLLFAVRYVELRTLVAKFSLTVEVTVEKLRQADEGNFGGKPALALVLY